MLDMLPPEILFLIASRLNDADYISLSNVNLRFSQLLPSSKREVNLSSAYSADLPVISLFLHNSPVTKLDLGDCYWLEPSLLTDLLKQLSPTLISLKVQGTKLSSSQLAEILAECTLITQLSLSISHEDASFWLPALPEEAQPRPAFFNARKTLNKLTELSLYGDIYSFQLFLVILFFCENLESLHLEMNALNRFLEEGDLNDKRVRPIRNAWMLSPFISLKKISSRIHNGNFMSNFFVASFIKDNFLKRYQDSVNNRKKFDVLWVPHGGVTSTVPLLSPNSTGLLTSNLTVVEMAELRGLESLSIRPDARANNSAILRDATQRLPNLKLISCPYISKDFLGFVRNHLDLRVIQLQSNTCHNLAGAELAEGLMVLKRLEKFSVDPRYFRDYVNRWTGAIKIDPSQQYSVHSPLSLVMVQLSEKITLKEVEIGVFTTLSQSRYDREDHTSEVSSSALKMMSFCTNLEKITLANLDVDSTSFLSPIVARCRRLKSCRLTNIQTSKSTTTMISSMVNGLKIGLPLSSSLQDFRWEIGKSKFEFKKAAESSELDLNLDHLLSALKLCRSLRRFAIIADDTIRLDLTGTGALDWPSLVLACIISPTADWEKCELNIKSEHPAFQCYLGGSKSEAADRLETVHYQEMILFDSNVAKTPY